MFFVAMVTRRLRKGKSYEDFRKAWFHKTGFGGSSKFYTMINIFDPNEIIVMSIMETEIEKFKEQLEIEIKERLESSLDDIIEPDIERKFGLLVSEDDFSASGSNDYKPASISGNETNFEQFRSDLQQIASLIQAAAQKRDSLKNKKS